MFVFQMSNGNKLPVEVKPDKGQEIPEEDHVEIIGSRESKLPVEVKQEKKQEIPEEDHIEVIGSREFCSRCYTILCPTQFTLNLLTYNLTGYCTGCDLKITFLPRKRKRSGSDSDSYDRPITRSLSKYMK